MLISLGQDVALSDNERWLYISAPEDNKIYAYNKVDVQSQTLNFTGDGSNNRFYYCRDNSP